MLETNWPDEAGRAAYLAAFHAAQALIFEREHRVLKTHNGVHSEFAKLVRDDPAYNDTHRRFLSRGYEFKNAADYGIGRSSDVTVDRALRSIETATALVDIIERQLST